MPLIPIRTETPIRRTPWVNYGLIATNALVYLLTDAAPLTAPELKRAIMLEAGWPSLYQFLTYQFAHGDIMHLLGNMLFLWVFGNSVNAKMNHVPYLFFYLAAGVFAALGYAATSNATLLGASGSIAAVTTAYLVLFPRSHVTTLVWLFVFVQTFQLPAMLVIGLKIILWDNIIAPSFGSGPQNVAYGAHLAGYAFGFAATMFMLLAGGLPRDQFDMLALWSRWRRRQVFAAVMSDPQARAQAQFGRVARPIIASAAAHPAEAQHLDAISDLRLRIRAHLDRREVQAAATLYEELLALDPRQCLSQPNQVEVGRAFYESARFVQAINTFERYLTCYPNAPDADDIRLLVGIIYARDLGQFELAERFLSSAAARFGDGPRGDLATRWLRDVRAAMGKVS